MKSRKRRRPTFRMTNLEKKLERPCTPIQNHLHLFPPTLCRTAAGNIGNPPET
jgi:hypothetical protein